MRLDFVKSKKGEYYHAKLVSELCTKNDKGQLHTSLHMQISSVSFNLNKLKKENKMKHFY